MDINSSVHSAQTVLDQKGRKIDHSHPEYFALKAQQNLKSVISGRHPKSLPKNSELWHYSKVSTERRNRIKKGHQFWDVVEKDDSSLPNTSNVTISIPDDAPDDISALADDADHTTDLNATRSTTATVLSRVKQIKATPASHSKENLVQQVDFKHKSQINFGMSFIIMNYLDEILHVDKNNELRSKPFNMILPTDRIKFKMIDIQNPSNPQALRFGDAMWIQCLDPMDNADNSFQSGIILSAKLFGPPELKSVQFDISAYTKQAEADKDLFDLPPTGKRTAPPPSRAAGEKGRRSSVQPSTPAPVGGAGGAAQQFAAEALPEGSIDPNAAAATPATAPTDAPTTAAGGAIPDPAIPEPVSSFEHVAEAKQTKRSEQADNQAKLCGEINLIRIIEMRKDIQFVHDGAMSDEKATRYNSKQSTLLGKWAIHSAVRPDLKGHTASSGPDPSKEDPHVYSLTPIVIQQDLYCIGTAHPNEFGKWPTTSHTIIHESKHISKEDEELFNEFYDKNGYKNRPNALAAWKAQKGEHVPNTNIPPSKANYYETPEESNVVCLRKLVARGFPYDFSVDRKCVWKICLFEQFSDNNTQSEKDKIAQKVMETATLSLKLSQQRREGETVHIPAHNNSFGMHVPALVGGETFSRNLRQMIFRNSQMMENQFLQERRNHESRIKDYFKEKISVVMDKEEDVLKNGIARASARNSFTLNRSASSSLASPKNGTPTAGAAGIAAPTPTFLTLSASSPAISVSPYRKPAANVVLKPVSRTPKEGEQRKTESQRGAKTFKKETHELSETAQEIFKSRLQVIDPKQLLLNNHEALTNYDKLSAGEKVLAMHKTFAHIKKSSHVSIVRLFFCIHV